MKTKLNIFLIFAMILVGLFSHSVVAIAEPTFTFSGKGTAHGVGLDMSGVEALARAGTGYRDILSKYYTGVTIVGGRQGEWLKVGILNSSDVQVTVDDGSYQVYANNTGPGTVVARNTVTHVTYENGKYVTRIEGVGTWTEPGFTRIEPRGGGHLKILNNNRRFRGKILVQRSAASGLLWAINDINIEDYIKGVAEEPNSWPTEGQRTLAVASRTYALNKKLYSTRWDSENFDVDATLGSQYYLGFNAERPNLVAAADHTIGQVVMYGGKVIVAAYHGNSGGHTESLENVWGGKSSDYPYLRGVPSPWGKVYRWGPITFTKSRLQDIFNSHAESNIGTLYSIDLSNKTPSGRLRKVRLTGSAGTKEIWGYSQFANWLGLRSAFLDDGAAVDNWDEYILLENTGSKTAKVKLTFIFSNGPPQTITRRVAPRSRKTVMVDGLLRTGPSSVKIRSDRSIVAERTMYFGAKGGGAHNSVGVRRPSRRWYFAGGQTGKNIDTWLIIQNPRSAPTVVTATFMSGKGRRVKKKVVVNGYSRQAIRVNDVRGLASKATPAVVKSPAPVVVERISYFKFKKRAGGHGGIGSPTLSKKWYFAEGFTAPGFENRLHVFNPLNHSTKFIVKLSKNNGTSVSRTYKLGSRRRRTVILNRMLSGDEFGISVTSPRGIVAERTVYFNSGGKSGAHSTIGSKKGYKRWFFAEGFTGTGFNEFLTLLNLSDRPARVAVKYLSDGGGVAATRQHTVTPGSRKTITVGNTGELGPGRSIAMQVTSSEKVVAERVMYFSASRQNGLSVWTGGHVSRGAVKTSKRWYFAEGFSQ